MVFNNLSSHRHDEQCSKDSVMNDGTTSWAWSSCANEWFNEWYRDIGHTCVR